MDISRIGLGGFNCYLLRNGADALLIDTGMKNKREKLMQAVTDVGCLPENIRLAVLTHGDHDHAGNCAYLKAQFGIRIAMHEGDIEMVEKGDMTAGRKAKPDRKTPLFKLLSRMSRPIPFDPITPDVLLSDGDSLAEYGFDVSIVSTPGHSKGSIALVTPDGGAICGDLLCNFTHPCLHMMIDDMNEARESVEILKRLGVKTVYPATAGRSN